LVDSGSFDDAAVYKISEELAMVQTLDFFTPIVDTPELFGRIAAANALSDVYAMGGRPVTAMAIFAFPIGTIDPQIAVEVLQGASDVVKESGAALAGGHTIDDDTMKFGLSVTGFVHPQKMWTNAGAQVGDTLILTKALGTGTATAALKRGDVTERDIPDVLASMAQLNDVLVDLQSLSDYEMAGIHAATDITGFGFAGHALNLARSSRVSLRIDSSQLPRFERALDLIGRGFLTKAHRTNREYAGESSELNSVDLHLQNLLFDPQTSGGLLLAVSPDRADPILRVLQKRFPRTSRVGSVEQESIATQRLYFS